MKIKLWDGKSSLLLPSGRNIDASELREEYPFVNNGPVVLEYIGNSKTVGAIDSMEILRSNYNINPASSDDEALLAIKEIRAAPASEIISADNMPITKADMQLIEQHLTELELLIMEGSNV